MKPRFLLRKNQLKILKKKKNNSVEKEKSDADEGNEGTEVIDRMVEEEVVTQN